MRLVVVVSSRSGPIFISLDLNAVTKKGDSALILASYCGHAEVARILIEAGAGVC